MPKLKNTIQFSLDAQRLDALQQQAEGDESLGLVAKRFVIDRLEGTVQQEPINSDIEERFKSIDSKFSELIARIERLEGTGPINSSPGELGTVLDAIRELEQRFDQNNEINKLRSTLKMRQDEINDQQDKIERLEFRLRTALNEKSELEGLIQELQEQLEAKTPSDVDIEQNLLETPGELDQPDQPFLQTFPEASREEKDQEISTDVPAHDYTLELAEMVETAVDNQLYWLNEQRTLGWKIKNGVFFGFVGGNSEARLKKYRAKYFSDPIWDKFTVSNMGGREVSARWELKLSSHEPGSALRQLRYLIDYDLEKDPLKQQ